MTEQDACSVEASVLTDCLLEGQVTATALPSIARLVPSTAELLSVTVLTDEGNLLASSSNFLSAGDLRVSFMLLASSSIEGRCVLSRQPVMTSAGSSGSLVQHMQVSARLGLACVVPLFGEPSAHGPAEVIGCLGVQLSQGDVLSPRSAIHLLLLAKELSARLCTARPAFLEQLAPVLHFEADIAASEAADTESLDDEPSWQGSPSQQQLHSAEQSTFGWHGGSCDGDPRRPGQDGDGSSGCGLLVEESMEASRSCSWRGESLPQGDPADWPRSGAASGKSSRRDSQRWSSLGSAWDGEPVFGKGSRGAAGPGELQPGLGKLRRAQAAALLMRGLAFNNGRLEQQYNVWNAQQMAKVDAASLLILASLHALMCFSAPYLVMQRFPTLWLLGFAPAALLLLLLGARQSYCRWRNTLLTALCLGLAAWHVLLVSNEILQLAPQGHKLGIHLDGFTWLPLSALAFQVPFHIRLPLQLVCYVLCASLVPTVCTALQPSCSLLDCLCSGAKLLVGGVVLPLAALYWAERNARVTFMLRRPSAAA